MKCKLQGEFPGGGRSKPQGGRSCCRTRDEQGEDLSAAPDTAVGRDRRTVNKGRLTLSRVLVKSSTLTVTVSSLRDMTQETVKLH